MQQVAKKINLPENTLEKDAYSALPSLQKEEYLHNLLNEVIRLNPMGITVSDIRKNTYLSHSVIWHHLEIMASKGECFRVEQGDTDVYHLNKVIDSLSELDIIDDKSQFHYGFNFDLVENVYGKFLRIQRLRESRSETHNLRAGVLIPYHLMDRLMDILDKIKETRLNNEHLNEEQNKD